MRAAAPRTAIVLAVLLSVIGVPAPPARAVATGGQPTSPTGG